MRVAPAAELAPAVLRVGEASGEHGRGGLALVQFMAMRHAERAEGGAVSEASTRPVPRQAEQAEGGAVSEVSAPTHVKAAERARGVAGGDERFVIGLGDMGSASQHESFAKHSRHWPGR